MKKFGYGILAGLLAVPLCIVAAFAGLAVFAPASMPAPAISSLVHLDEKFRFLREHPEFDPRILAVGSSITWRQLAGKALEAEAGGPHGFLNGGTGYLRVHQTHALTRFYLSRFRNVRVVLVMIGPPDFRGCTEDPAELFVQKDAARYAFEGWPALYFYLRYFTPRRYLETTMKLAGRQAPLGGDLYLDPYGSGPVQLPDGVKTGLRYGKLDKDPACVDALVGLAQDLKDRGIHLMLVFPPVHPEYRARFPDEMRWLENAAARMERERQKNPRHLTVLRMYGDNSFAARDYFDAFHLQWPAVKILSTRIAQAMAVRPFVPPEEGLYSQRKGSS
ncbi:MAG: hypothetical protein GEU92_01185 [Alphaproteobacteria bacterium]|nr:hypothetical protein [Alphaproteobacteria bacterium]